MTERLQLDARLENINLHNPEVVYKALGGTLDEDDGTDCFDKLAYLNLPVGRRLLTSAEVEALPPGKRRPTPSNKDPSYTTWLSLRVDEDTGGDNPWRYNWNPKKHRPVYRDDFNIPDEMIMVVEQISSPEEQAIYGLIAISIIEDVIRQVR